MRINQIFSLSMVVDKEKFRKILTDKFDTEIHEENEKEYVDQSMVSDGITVIYRNSQYKKKVKVLVNLRLLLGDGENDTEMLVRKLDKHIKKCFNYRYRLDDFSLSEVLFTVDIDVHNHDSVESYIKVLRRIGKVKGFSQVYYDCFDDKESFCLDGNSNGIQFLIYDLGNLLKNGIERTGKGRKKLKSIAADTQGILRAEVRLTKPKTIRDYTGAVDVSEQLIELSKRRSEIFLDVFAQIVPYGDIYKSKRQIPRLAVSPKLCHTT